MSPPRRRFQMASLGITRGALILLGLEVGVSLVWLLCDPDAKQLMIDWIVATPHHVFGQARVWTLVTSPFLEDDFLSLLLQGLMMFMFVPTLERFWGTARFYRFFAITSVVGVAAGIGLGQLTGHDVAIHGLSPFMYGAIVAFGIIYAKTPVQIFGVLPLTGRQMMYGFLGFVTLFVVLQQKWELGMSYAAAMIAAALMTSKTYSPALWWKRRKIQRARAKLSVMQGGAPKPPPKRDDQKWLN